MSDGIARIDAGAAEMRQQRDVLQRDIAGIHLRLAVIDIQPGGSDVAGFQSGDQGSSSAKAPRVRVSPRPALHASSRVRGVPRGATWNLVRGPALPRHG
jgi:hypothetical protein